MTERVFSSPTADGGREEVVYLGPLRWRDIRLQQLVRVWQYRDGEIIHHGEEWRDVTNGHG